MENEPENEAFASVAADIPGDPQEIPNEDFNQIAAGIPDTIPKYAWEQGEKLPWYQRIFPLANGKMAAWNQEAARAEAANAMALAEVSGKQPHEVAHMAGMDLGNFQDTNLEDTVRYYRDLFKNSLDASMASLEAGKAYTEAMVSGDAKALEEAKKAFIEATKIGGEGDKKAPLGDTAEFLTDTIGGLADLAGSMGYTFGNLTSEEGKIGMATGALGGAMAGGIVGAAVGAIGTGFMTTYGAAAIGVHSLQMQAQGVPAEIADKVGIVTGSVEALLETVEMDMFVKSVPGLKNTVTKFSKEFLVRELTNRMVGAVGTGIGETTIESMQNLEQEIGANYAKELTNELRQNTNLKIETIGEIVEGILKQAKQMLPSMVIAGAVGHGVGMVGHTTGKVSQTMMRELSVKNMVQNLQLDIDQGTQAQVVGDQKMTDVRGAEVQVDEAVPAPEGAAGVVDEAGVQQPAVPITPIERTKEELNWDESPINDEEFDQVAESGTDEDIDTMVERDLTAAREAGSYYGDFMAAVRTLLPRKQAKAIDKLLEARARATNRTKEQFAEDHKLVLRPGEEGSGGTVEFVKDSETIIRAFQNTTVKDVVHELGHVFRKDLNETELQAAEKAFGVEDGNWTTQQEEQFANGFTEFLATGEAPTKSLEGVFNKLKTWFGHVLHTLKRERIPMSPEMEALYAGMLRNKADGEYIHKIAQAREETSQTLYAPRKKSVKTQVREATGQHPIRSGKMVDEYVAFKEGLKKRAQDARAAQKAGNKEGYAKAKAEYKAMVRRARKRTARIKSRAKLRERITKLVKSKKVKTQAGKPKGQFTASFQDQVDKMIRIMKLPVKEAKKLSREMDEKVGEDFGTWEDKLERQLLRTRANVQYMDETSLSDLYDDLKEFFDYGKELRNQELAETQANIEQGKQAVKESLASLAERKGFDPKSRNAYESRVNNFKKTWHKLLWHVLYDFKGMMELLDMGLKDAIGEGAARKFAELIDAQNASREGQQQKSQEMMLGAAQIYDLKDENGKPSIGLAKRYFWKEERKGKRHVVTINLIDKEGRQTGETHELNLTQAEIRNLWMELQDPELAKVWEDYGLTEADKKVILSQLTEKDIRFIDFQLAQYNQYYDEINSVYQFMYGANLARRKNYSPILRNLDRLPGHGAINALLMEQFPQEYHGVGAASLKSRVDSKAVTKSQSDLAKWNFYVRQMEHFKAFAPKMREVNSVFRNPEVKRTIENVYGEEFYRVLSDTLNDITKGGTSVNYELWINRVARSVRANLARGMVGAKPLAMVKQLTSAVAYTSEMPVGEYMKGLAEFLSDPKKHMQELYDQSALIRTRGESITRDIAEMYKSAEFSGIVSKHLPPSFNNIVMMFVKAGDVGAIYAGGYSYYRHLVNQGMPKAEAIRKMEIKTLEVQQSAELSDLTMAQRGPEFLQLFTMFITAPRQYTQKLFLAYEGAVNNRMSPADAMKQFAIYAVALPVLFQIAAQVGSTDDEALRSYLKVVLTSPLKSVPMMGQIADYLGSVFIEKTDYGKGPMDIPIAAPAGEAVKGFNKLIKKDSITYEEVLKALRQMAAVTEYTGIPGRQAVNIAIGMSDIGQGEVTKGGLEIGGLSPYAAARRVK